jgi:hypothetical protein
LDKYKVLQDPNEALHRTVKDVVASYNSPWDPLTELIQNAIDAVNQRAVQAKPGFVGKLRLVIDSAAQAIIVEDNGIGIPKGSHGDVVLPGGSLKTQGNTYGHKGLGFTYCAHIASEIRVHSAVAAKKSDTNWAFVGGFQWLNDPTHDPEFKTAGGPSLRTFGGTGTAVRLVFAIGTYEEQIANTAVLDHFFEWADDEKLLPFVLRTRTAIGQVSHLFGETPPVTIEVDVEFVKGARKLRVPFEFFDFQNLPPFNQQTFPLANDYATNIVKNHNIVNKTNFGIHHVFDHDASDPNKPLLAGTNKGGVRFSVFVYACGKRNLAEALKQYDPRLDAAFKYLGFSTDVHLAIDGMPCGVPLDSWNNWGGHEERYFAIVNAELRFGTVLDAGRKTISRYYVDLIVDKTVEMTKDDRYFGGVSFYHLSTHLHVTSALPPDRTPISYIDRWDQYVALPAKSLLLQKLPDDELGVYVLFGELVGSGFIPGFTMRYVSGAAVYDAALSFELDLSNPAHLNSTVPGGKARFGVGNALVQQQKKAVGFPRYRWRNFSGVEFLVTEFKVTGEELLRDLQGRRSQKMMTDLDLLVCVSCDASQISQLSGALLPIADAARALSGVTHRLSYAAKDISVISLVDVIRALVTAGELK